MVQIASRLMGFAPLPSDTRLDVSCLGSTIIKTRADAISVSVYIILMTDVLKVRSVWRRLSCYEADRGQAPDDADTS